VRFFFALAPISIAKTGLLRNFPFLSRSVGTVIVLMAGLTYIKEIVQRPLDQIAGVLLTAFGVIAALSALCFSAAPCYSDQSKGETLYAGEKFLHSCVAIIQLLFLKYAVSRIPEWEFIKGLEWIDTLARIVLGIFGLGAMYFAWLGLMYLNIFLWKRYEFWVKRKKRQLRKDHDGN
jgi:hypothetical protein